MIEELNIKVGKTYRIKHLIEELKKHPDITLGHIFALNEHLYYQNASKLKELYEKMIRADRGGTISYDVYGKNKVNIYDVYVLGIMDPYDKYRKYDLFYKEFYDYIANSLESTSTGVIDALEEEIAKEAMKLGYEFEKHDDLLDGIYIYFIRKGIESFRVIKGESGKRKRYIEFAKEGVISREEGTEKLPKKEKVTLLGLPEEEKRIIRENTKEFESFYSDLEKTITTFIIQNKRKNALVNLEDVDNEIIKVFGDIGSKKDVFMKGMILYLNEKGFSAEKSRDDSGKYHMIFEKL